jgi:oligoendopeptidase F
MNLTNITVTPVHVAFDEVCEKRWIDWSPRPAKRPGAFCATSDFHGEPRIFMTYNECAHDLMTLAHELGHAWHSRLLDDRRAFAKEYPMTLAESASTFAELMLVRGMLADPGVDAAVKCALANQAVGHAASFLLDIPVRYHFERELCERRAAGELSVSQLSELMVAAQRRTFGEVLLEGEEHPLFWASKGHFYMDQVSFYNFPYTFGYLLSRLLQGMLDQAGPGFLASYEEFLRRSGTASCEVAVRETLGREIGETAFWMEAIDTLEETFTDARRWLERAHAAGN